MEENKAGVIHYLQQSLPGPQDVPHDDQKLHDELRNVWEMLQVCLCFSPLFFPLVGEGRAGRGEGRGGGGRSNTYLAHRVGELFTSLTVGNNHHRLHALDQLRITPPSPFSGPPDQST